MASPLDSNELTAIENHLDKLSALLTAVDWFSRSDIDAPKDELQALGQIATQGHEHVKALVQLVFYRDGANAH